MGILSTAIGLSLLAFRTAVARNITFDNTSPQVVFSPLPCFQQDVQGCSIQWQLKESIDAFNGSFTTTTGTDSSLEQDAVLPRVSLTFQGTDVVFMPGLHSTALASVIVDDLSSLLINTSQNAFSGTGLDPAQNHTITITFVPNSHRSTTLDIDYFLITQPDGNGNGTSPPISSLSPMPLPTSLPPTTPSPPPTSSSSSAIPTGTIAAISLSGGLLLLTTLVACLVIARRHRRRAALHREKAILYNLRLPSDPGAGRPKERQWDESAWRDAGNREKGKARESVLPPVHYTPWR